MIAFFSAKNLFILTKSVHTIRLISIIWFVKWDFSRFYSLRKRKVTFKGTQLFQSLIREKNTGSIAHFPQPLKILEIQWILNRYHFPFHFSIFSFKTWMITGSINQNSPFVSKNCSDDNRAQCRRLHNLTVFCCRFPWSIFDKIAQWTYC